MTVEHLILAAIVGFVAAQVAVVAVAGFVTLRRMKADSDRTFRVLGALIVQESEKIQAILRD